MKNTTRTYKTYAEFVAQRQEYLGGSDFASVVNKGRYGCSRKLGYDKLGYAKDFDDSDRMEFRRGRRLEGVAAALYTEQTGRETWITTTISVPGRPHLSVNIDRFIAKIEDKEKANWGYLEIKVVGRHSWFKIKKDGLIDDYVIQVQAGMAVADVSWGAFGIYCPDLDEMVCWDFEADKAFGEHLLEAGDDWWQFHKECKVLPEPLPIDSPPCEGCPWAITCRGEAPANAGTVSRPDLEGLAAKFAEVKGMGSEAGDAEESLRAEFMEAVKGAPGIYVCGKYEVPFTITKTKRFSQPLLKKDNPALYEKYMVEGETRTVRKPKLI